MTNPFSSGHHILLGRTDPYIPAINNVTIDLTDNLHALIVGTTGSGKTRLLESVFLQGLNIGHGMGILEPHHDLSFDTLTYLISKGFFDHPQAFDQLVYIDWNNGAYVPFNILAGNGEEIHSLALNALDAMTRVWPELESAPTFQTLFTASVVALIANHLPITYLYKLIIDQSFRNICLKKVSDETVLDTFRWYDALKPNEQANQAGSLIRRAQLLCFNPVARLTLGQRDNWLDFRRMMDHGISFIINLGNIRDHETRRIIGANILVQIEQAALSRTDLLPSQRRDFTLLVDEWPSFAAQDKTIGTILSQTRKFNLRLWLAGQSLSQISSERLVGATENCRLTILFALGSHSADIEAKQIATVDPYLIKEEGLTDTQHAQYVSIMEQFTLFSQELRDQDTRHAIMKLRNKPPIRMKSLNMPSTEVDPAKVKEVLAEYKRRYQRTEDQIHQAQVQTPLPPQPKAQVITQPVEAVLFSANHSTDDLPD